jgi:hypothetical protein
MATLEKEIGLEHLNLIQRRLEILVGGRLKDRYKIQKAAESINSLRRKCEGFDSVAEIRKWRGEI